MKAVYLDSALAEKEAKKRYCFGEGIMMENAACALEKAVDCAASSESSFYGTGASVLVLCGGGNNGGDGFALARRISGRYSVSVVCTEECKSLEAQKQLEMALSAGVPVLSLTELFFPHEFISDFNIFVDCIYGTGFHGGLRSGISEIIQKLNGMTGAKIACDIPSGIDRKGCIPTKDKDGNPVAFAADVTVTMGALKTALFSDAAKDFTGRVEVAGLGISSALFEKCAVPDAFLLESADKRLPVRKKQNVHKGTFGHVGVVMGEKPGAAIIAAGAAFRFGAGLVTCAGSSGCSSVPPELMVSPELPSGITAVLAGSGMGRNRTLSAENSAGFIRRMKFPAAVLDADFFYYGMLPEFLAELDGNKDARIILTPHPKELSVLLAACGIEKSAALTESTYSSVIERRFDAACEFSMRFPNLVLVSKGANTFIMKGKERFICSSGTNALAKAGSGDVLAGLCTGLLAQGYDALEAAITAVLFHAESSAMFSENYALTPIELLKKI